MGKRTQSEFQFTPGRTQSNRGRGKSVEEGRKTCYFLSRSFERETHTHKHNTLPESEEERRTDRQRGGEASNNIQQLPPAGTQFAQEVKPMHYPDARMIYVYPDKQETDAISNISAHDSPIRSAVVRPLMFNRSMRGIF